MNRFALIAALLVASQALVETDAHAEFVESIAAVRTSNDAVRTVTFEPGSSVSGLSFVTPAGGSAYSLDRRAITSLADFGDRLVQNDPIEGTTAARMSDGTGLLLADPETFSRVRGGRFEVTFWALADGAGPVLQVVYAQDSRSVYGGDLPFASVRAVRTGKQTSDGWAEFSTGALDGNVWGVPAAAIVVNPPSSRTPGAAFVIDAIEVHAAAGKPIEPVACTQATVESACGAEGDCIYGHCVSSTVTWGPLLSESHRSDIAERWIHYATRVMGDRNSVGIAREVLVPQARALAKTARSSRQFTGGLARLVNLLRNNHTSFGMKGDYSRFYPHVAYSSSGVLGACFGLVERDLTGGGFGFSVFKTTPTSYGGPELRRGDLVVAIDGREPKEWADSEWPRFARTLPNDPESDWGTVANDLSDLVTARAQTITIERCESPSCTAKERTRFDVDVAALSYAAIRNGVMDGTPRGIRCSTRFENSVAAADTTYYGGNVLTETGPNGETRVQFDGFDGDADWKSSMTGVFAKSPRAVIMDARVGHGGQADAVSHLLDLMRGADDPMGVLAVGRGTYDFTEDPTLLSRASSCANDGSGGFWTCYSTGAWGFFSQSSAAPGAQTRVAWLNISDVSANDFMPKLLQGRHGLRIFAPHPTSGAFGAVVELPLVMSGFGGATIQVQDARFAQAADGIAAARWESGHGVVPDQVVIQKHSDTLAGIDTMLTVATKWLAESE